jgi:hypothetical protein
VFGQFVKCLVFEEAHAGKQFMSTSKLIWQHDRQYIYFFPFVRNTRYLFHSPCSATVIKCERLHAVEEKIEMEIVFKKKEVERKEKHTHIYIQRES